MEKSYHQARSNRSTMHEHHTHRISKFAHVIPCQIISITLASQTPFPTGVVQCNVRISRTIFRANHPVGTRRIRADVTFRCGEPDDLLPCSDNPGNTRETAWIPRSSQEVSLPLKKQEAFGRDGWLSVPGPSFSVFREATGFWSTRCAVGDQQLCRLGVWGMGDGGWKVETRLLV